MLAQSRRRSARALASVTALGLAATGAVVLAPSANAFYGSDATVKAAVLSTAKIAAAAGWNPAVLTGSLTDKRVPDWTNVVTPASLTNAQVAPESSGLLVTTDPAERDRLFATIRADISATATYVATNTSSVYTITTDDGPSATSVYGVSLRKAGSDGLAITSCRATATTTTAPVARAACANRVGVAQAATWAKISPALVWRSTKAVKAKLLSSAAARKATKAPKGTKTKVVRTKSMKAELGGREVNRVYKTTGKGVRFAGPSLTSITQYGNRTNAFVAHSAYKSLMKLYVGKLYDVKSDRFTVYVSSKVKGKTSRAAVTIVRYSDVVIAATCEGNPSKQPAASSVRACSKRLAAAELKKAKPLFSKIK